MGGTHNKGADEDEVGLLQTQRTLPVDHHQTHHAKVPDEKGKREPVQHQVVDIQDLTIKMYNYVI